MLAGLQKPPGTVPDSADRSAPLLFDAEHRPITSRGGWQARCEQIRKEWLSFLGQIPSNPARPELETHETDRDAGVIRSLVRYESEPGLRVEGYLLEPETRGQGRPGAVVLHSTVDSSIKQPAGLDGPEDKHIGLHLARRGYVAFCPRCFLWQYGPPDNISAAVDWLRERHPDIRGMAKMLFDARRAVDVLVSRPNVDPKRIGAIGHSLGGKEVLYLAAFDERVRAAVSSEGGIGISYSNWEAPWYLGETVQRPGFPLDHAQVLALTAPRAFLLIGGDSADGTMSWPYIEAVMPVWNLLGEPRAVGLFDHHEGHAVPESARAHAYAWLDWFLRA